MNRNLLIVAFVGVCCVLLLQPGCGEANKPEAEGPKLAKAPDKAPPAPEPVKPAPEKPKAEPEKPAPKPEKTTPEPVKVAPKPAPARPRPVRKAPTPVPPRPPAPRRGTPAPKPVIPKRDPNAPAPEIRFEKVVHNFGDVGPETKNDCEYGFSNVGKGMLKIINIKPDCGCTAYTLKKRDYAPGEKGILKIKYSATTRPGPVSKHIEVTSDDPVKPTISLTLRANIAPLVENEPKRLNLLLNKEDGAPLKITLTSMDGKPFSVTRLTSTNNALSADIDPAVVATKFVLVLKFDKARLQRASRGVVEISMTHPGAKNISIPFDALLRYRIMPPTIILFNAEPGKPIIRSNVSILNNYKEAFEIASTTSQNGYMKVIKEEKIGSGYRFSLEITPPDLTNARKFTDVFSIQVKDGDLLKITCQGFYARKKTTTTTR